jgi:beta-1,4-mannosyltransferase
VDAGLNGVTLTMDDAVTAAGGTERWAHWPRQTDSTYYPQFYGAMRAHGVTPVATLDLTREWLASREADAIHVHWPDGLWRQRGKGLIVRIRGVRQLRLFLSSARQAGLRLVWTVHNLGAHEGGDWVDSRGYAAVADMADLIVCHSRWSAEHVRRTYRPRGDIVVMPIGNADGFYPATRPRDAVLAELNLDPARPVVSCLGILRAYKGLELACDAVSRLHGEVQLFIGGPVFRKFDLGRIRESVARLPHAQLVARRLTDQEFADVTAASDATLLPYSNVTTSSALIASWSLGSGVVASDLPYFREMISPAGLAGRLFRAGDADSLAAQIADYLRVPRETRSAAALAEARKYSWRSCVAPVAEWIVRHRQAAPDQSYAMQR